MYMRRIIVILNLMVCLVLTCSLGKPLEYSLYVNSEGPFTEYLSLRTNLNVSGNHYFEYYTSRGDGSVIGVWTLEKDMMVLTPMLEVTYMGDRLIDIPIPADMPDTLRTNRTIQKVFIVKDGGKKIIDITDYSTLFPNPDTVPKKYFTPYKLAFEDGKYKRK